MAWSTPKTWSAGEVVTAALKNAERDNFNILKTSIDDLGNLSPSIETDASTTQQDDLAITTTSGTLVFTGASDFDLTGIVAPADEGKLLSVIARGSGTVTLKDEDANSTAANRFDLGGQDVALLTDHAILLVYENSRWRRLGAEALLTVSQAEAEAGTATTRRLWTAERVKQAIDALTTSGASKGYRSGGLISRNATNPNFQLDIASDLICRDDGDNEDIQYTSTITVDITASGANGLDTGSEASGTWYYVWAIKKSSDGTVAGLLSTSATSPTMPTGYDRKRLIGAWYNDGSSNFLDMIHHEDGWFLYDAPVEDYNATPSASWTTVTCTAPPSSKVVVHFKSRVGSNNAALAGVREVGQNVGLQSDEIWSFFLGGASTGTVQHSDRLALWTDTSAQIELAAVTTNTEAHILNTYGFWIPEAVALP